ncbi:hypothetical protein [Mycolicibacterium palauense]|uniref:hypothetical protein n=1 Tax=Mycolicibacterium palauense TaxID=2034511 RepID=UPI00159BBCD8|nr:hypothetical protein [Mycolicibacterium palauense]
MRIHSNVLTEQHFYEAAIAAGVTVVGVHRHGSRSRERAYDFGISGSGRSGGQWGHRDYKSATWDEWGIFLAHLFEVDQDAHTGKHGYLSADHFHWVTGDRFRYLTPDGQHKRHNWLSGDHRGTSATGSYWVQSCACGAIQRSVKHGHSWAEIAA